MRIRTIKPEFWEDELIGGMSPDARLAYIWLWGAADDYGRLANLTPARLRAGAFMHHENFTPKKAADILGDLVAARRVVFYIVGDSTYAHIPKFLDHQRISHPRQSRIPAPEEGQEQSVPEPGLEPTKPEATTNKLRFDPTTNAFDGITDIDIGRWKELFGLLDIKHQLKLAEDWCRRKPSRAPKRDAHRFLMTWFKNAQADAHARQTTLQSEAGPSRQARATDALASRLRKISTSEELPND